MEKKQKIQAQHLIKTQTKLQKDNHGQIFLEHRRQQTQQTQQKYQKIKNNLINILLIIQKQWRNLLF
jgi:hypothetical protein